jgi:hypothetical protein
MGTLRIASFDVATSTGICWGVVGVKQPDTTTWNMREAGPWRPARLLLFFQKLSDFFADEAIDQVWYECPLNVAVVAKIGASEETVALLRGMVGVLELAAARAGIKHIQPFDVRDAREHFTGQRTHGRTKAGKNLGKQAVMDVCRMLRIEVEDADQADAVAGWSMACGLANPRLAHLVTPLFAERHAS